MTLKKMYIQSVLYLQKKYIIYNIFCQAASVHNCFHVNSIAIIKDYFASTPKQPEVAKVDVLPYLKVSSGSGFTWSRLHLKLYSGNVGFLVMFKTCNTTLGVLCFS